MFWIELIVSVALYIAARLLTPKPPGQKLATDVTVSTSAIGQVIPWVMGTAKISPNIVWYGNFAYEVLHRSAGFLKGTTVAGQNYYLDVQEIICSGPIHSLKAIFQDVDIVPEFSIVTDLITGQKVTNPTGNISDPTNSVINPASEIVVSALSNNRLDSFFTINKIASRLILMGGRDSQPTVPELLRRITPQTAYPNLCYALWLTGAMGQGNTWPNLSYVVTRYPQLDLLGDTDFLIIDETGASGINPAFAINELLRAVELGSTYQASEIDLVSLWNIAQIFKQEKIFCNFQINDSTTREDILNTLFNDLGISCFELFGQLTFRLLRSTNNYKVIRRTDNGILNSLLLETPSEETDYLVNSSNNQLAQFTDQALNFRINQIPDFDLGAINTFSQLNPQTRNFSFYNNQSVINKIIQLQKSLTAQAIPFNTFKFAYGDLYLEPTYKLKDLVANRSWRVLKITENTDDTVEINVIEDVFRPTNFNTTSPVSYLSLTQILQPVIGLESTTWTGTTNPTTSIPEATLFELPWEVNQSDSIFLAVPAIKPNPSIVQASYLAQRTNNSQAPFTANTSLNYFQKIESTEFCQGLRYQTQTSNTNFVYLSLIHSDQDPVVITQVDDEQWNLNEILTLVNNELISIRKFETTSSFNSNYRIALSDMKRGRLGTEVNTTFNTTNIFTNTATFFFNSPTVIGQDKDVTLGGVRIRILTQTSSAQLDINNTTPLTINITGVASGPLPVENLTARRDTTDNHICIFEWENYGKSDIGKVNLLSATPPYDAQFSLNKVNWTTAPLYTTFSTLSAHNITGYVRTLDSSNRASIKRFTDI